jgi:hypothetical protein
MRASKAISTSEIIRIEGKFTDQRLPEITAAVARRELAPVEAEAPAPYAQIVDGNCGAPLESVKPGGRIVFQFNREGVAIDWIYARLLEAETDGS